MASNSRIDKISEISKLILESKILKMKASADAKFSIESQISDLNASECAAGFVTDISDAVTKLSYQIWADRRRQVLNRNLATQTAIWLDARDEALQAHGKFHSLAMLRSKFGKTS